jgi:hypothetical protein
VSADRFASVDLLASDDFAQPLANWTRLTNPMVLTNGVIRIDGVDSDVRQQRFFIVGEHE